ncbi:MAG: hypothetical protein ABIR17_01720 [Pseudolysinimonas sp.]|uniref:hypothetical protein n=1 Tax=Pseudolysinimonas sp. TaxID=2680009 RepID=UPI0032653C4A
MTARMPFTFIVVPGAILLLAGCGGGGVGGSTAAAVDTASCMVGDWASDPQDIANQMVDALSSLGTASATGTGTEKATIAATHLSYDDNLEFTFDVAPSSGPTVQIVQNHSGRLTADWTIGPDDVMAYANFDTANYQISSTTVIDGHSSTSTSNLPQSSAHNVPTAVTCSGDTMTMKPEDSPILTTWHRQG